MEQSLTVEKSAGQISKEELDIDKDIDRFHIRIRGGAGILNGKEVSVKLKTTENSEAKYNDDETEVELVAENGDLISKSLLLTSDDIDDDFAGDIEVGADDQEDDRTHVIQLGGNLVLSKAKIGDDEYELNLKKTVQKRKTVNVNFVILDDGNLNLQDTKDRLNKDLEIAKERFSQVGVDIVKHSEVIKASPNNLDLPQGELRYSGGVVDEKISLSGDSKKIIQHAATVGNTDDLHVIYVPYKMVSGGVFGGESFGVALAKFAIINGDLGFSENIFISPAASSLVLSHEIGHILTQGGHVSNDDFLDFEGPNTPTDKEIDQAFSTVRKNLMNGGLTYKKRIGDTKRLLSSQEEEIFKSPHVK